MMNKLVRDYTLCGFVAFELCLARDSAGERRKTRQEEQKIAGPAGQFVNS